MITSLILNMRVALDQQMNDECSDNAERMQWLKESMCNARHNSNYLELAALAINAHIIDLGE